MGYRACSGEFARRGSRLRRPHEAHHAALLPPARTSPPRARRNEFTPTVAQRGGALIKKWGRSSAASTAVSIADAIRSLVTPTAPGDCFSSGVITDGNPYGIQVGWRAWLIDRGWLVGRAAAAGASCM